MIVSTDGSEPRCLVCHSTQQCHGQSLTRKEAPRIVCKPCACPLLLWPAAGHSAAGMLTVVFVTPGLYKAAGDNAMSVMCRWKMWVSRKPSVAVLRHYNGSKYLWCGLPFSKNLMSMSS